MTNNKFALLNFQEGGFFDKFVLGKATGKMDESLGFTTQPLADLLVMLAKVGIAKCIIHIKLSSHIDCRLTP